MIQSRGDDCSFRLKSTSGVSSPQWIFYPDRRNARPAGNFSPACPDPATGARTCSIGLKPIFGDSVGVSGSCSWRTDCIPGPEPSNAC